MPEDNDEAADASQEVSRGPGRLPFIPRLGRVLPVAAGLLVLGGFAVFGIELGFLVLAGVVLSAAIFLMWSSVQSLTGGSELSFDEALGMGAPSRTEEQKRSVLRALKDLEYERSVGKISPADYAEYSQRYREEAKRLMQALDETLGPARARTERAIERHLVRAGLPPTAPAERAERPPEESK